MITELTAFWSEIATNLADYAPLIALLGGIFGGEIAILVLSFLAAQGVFPIIPIFLFFWFGEIIADWIYYELGRSKLFLRLKQIRKVSQSFNYIDKFISKVSGRSVFLTLLYSKCIYGTRTATVVFLGLKKVDRKEFIRAEIIVLFIVVAILSTIGWSAGRGYSFVMDHFKSIQLALTLVVILFILFVLLREKINQIVLNIAKRK